MFSGLPGRFNDSDDIPQNLLHLADEIMAAKHLISLPADLPADLQLAIIREHAIGIAFRGCPAFGLYDFHW